MTSSRPHGTPGPVPAGVVVHALVPAAGRGDRFGGEAPKQLIEVRGRQILAWTVERLLSAGCSSVVVAVREEDLARQRILLPVDERVLVVVGGATRQASVFAALEGSPAGPSDWVAVHDGARAALAFGDFSATLAAALSADGAVLGREVTDTLKELDGDRVVRTVDRARLFRAETPQVFRRSTLEEAFAAARRDGFVGTDEASLVERLGDVRVTAVRARRPNPKLTYPEDLAELERVLAKGDRD